MSVNFNQIPVYLLTRFERTNNAPQADGLEKFGNVAMGLLQLSCGKTFRVTKVKSESSEASVLCCESKKSYHLITRIALAALFIVTLPVSLPLTIAGLIALHSSKSYTSLFASKVSQVPEIDDFFDDDLKETRVTSAWEAVSYICKHKKKCADLREFPDLEDWHLEYLAQNNPQLQKLVISSEKVTKMPNEFKDLEYLECHICPKIDYLPGNLSKLRKLILTCTAVEDWPESLQNLEVLHLIETPMKKLPSTLKKLKEFSRWNSSWIEESELAKIPKNCKVLKDLPNDFNLD